MIFRDIPKGKSVPDSSSIPCRACLEILGSELSATYRDSLGSMSDSLIPHLCCGVGFAFQFFSQRFGRSNQAPGATIQDTDKLFELE